MATATILAQAAAAGQPGLSATLAPGDLARLLQRDPAAWSAVFEREHPVIFRYIYARIGYREAAEDIAGQVFLEALEGIARYRETGRPLLAWLLVIARHRSIDWLRRRGREQSLPEGADFAAEAAPPLFAPALEALAILTPEQREVVHLRFVEGYAIDEVARLTGRNANAVKALQHRAIRRLRANLTPQGA